MERLRSAMRNNNGMTLIEIMIALLLLMVVALAVMQTALVGMNANLQNAMRDAAVNFADQKMAEVREWPFNNIVSGAIISDETVTFRGASVTYSGSLSPVNDIDTNTKQAFLTVNWQFRGKTYTHSISTVVRNQ